MKSDKNSTKGDSIEKVISDRTQYIEQKVGGKLSINPSTTTPYGAAIDWPNWHDKNDLPPVVFCKSVGKVHILHELVHLEKFFVEQYAIIAHADDSLSTIDEVFKNLPEDYVAHKVIKDEYGFDPIDKAWFKRGKDQLTGLTDEQIAANLVNFWAFTEFCPEYKKERRHFSKECKKDRPAAFDIANKGIQALKSMDWHDHDSYNHAAEEILRIFAPEFLKKRQLLLAVIKRTAGTWSFVSI